MSRETTFERDLHAVRDRAELGAVFTRPVRSQVAGDLQRKAYAGKTIGIKLRFDDFKSVTRDLTLPAHVMDAQAIRRAAGACLKRVDLTRRLRLLGVRAGALATLAELLAPRADPVPAPQSAGPRVHERPASRTLPLFGTDDFAVAQDRGESAPTVMP